MVTSNHDGSDTSLSPPVLPGSSRNVQPSAQRYSNESLAHFTVSTFKLSPGNLTMNDLKYNTPILTSGVTAIVPEQRESSTTGTCYKGSFSTHVEEMLFISAQLSARRKSTAKYPSFVG